MQRSVRLVWQAASWDGSEARWLPVPTLCRMSHPGLLTCIEERECSTSDGMSLSRLSYKRLWLLHCYHSLAFLTCFLWWRQFSCCELPRGQLHVTRNREGDLWPTAVRNEDSYPAVSKKLTSANNCEWAEQWVLPQWSPSQPCDRLWADDPA